MIKKPLHLNTSEHYNSNWTHFVPAGSTKEDVLDPSFWGNVARQLRIGDEIKIMTEDMAWRGLFLVRAVGRVEAVVQLIDYVDLGEKTAALTPAAESPYEVKWGSPAVKWRVHLRSNGEVVKDMFQTREEAAKWVGNHLMAAA